MEFCYHENVEKIDTCLMCEEYEYTRNGLVNKLTYRISYECLDCGEVIAEDTVVYEDLDGNLL